MQTMKTPRVATLLAHFLLLGGLLVAVSRARIKPLAR